MLKLHKHELNSEIKRFRVQDREVREYKEAFEELESERDDAVRKAQEKERSKIKDETDAVHIFIAKVLEENDALQDKVSFHCLIIWCTSACKLDLGAFHPSFPYHLLGWISLQVRELEGFRSLQTKLVEAEVDRDIFKRSLSLYKEFFDFVRNNNCLNQQVVSSSSCTLG